MVAIWFSVKEHCLQYIHSMKPYEHVAFSEGVWIYSQS